MKTLAMSLVLLVSSMSFAAQVTCPEGYKKTYSCKLTPQAGDHDVAAAMLEGITVCSQGPKAVLIAYQGTEVDVKEAKVEARMGGTTYTLDQPSTKIELAVVTGILSIELPAKLNVTVKEPKVTLTSTYTCTR